jgi:hypothetical protein
MSLARRLAIYALAQRHGRELLVGRLLLLQIGVKETHDVIVPERFRPGDQRAVASYLIVLNSLCGPDYGRVENVLVGDLAGDLIAFLDQPLDGRALPTLRLLAEFLKGLVETLDLLFGLLQMVLEALLHGPRFLNWPPFQWLPSW